MSYPAALLLVALSAVFLLAGIVTGSASAHFLASAASAAAVILLYQRIQRTRAQTFVTAPPPKLSPVWGREAAPAQAASPDNNELDRIIDGYHDLLAAEVLPALETLSADELRILLDAERRGRNRATIIKRAEVLLALTMAPEPPAAVADPSAPKRRAPRKTATKSSEMSSEKAPAKPKANPKSRAKSGPSLTD